MNPEWGASPEREREILQELDWEFRPEDPDLRLLIGVVATALGAETALLFFTFSLTAAVIGMAIMALGVGAGVVPGALALRSRR